MACERPPKPSSLVIDLCPSTRQPSSGSGKRGAVAAAAALFPAPVEGFVASVRAPAKRVSSKASSLSRFLENHGHGPARGPQHRSKPDHLSDPEQTELCQEPQLELANLPYIAHLGRRTFFLIAGHHDPHLRIDMAVFWGCSEKGTCV